MKKLFKGVKGRQILVSGLAVLVLVAGYYRWTTDQSMEVMPVMNDVLPTGTKDMTDNAEDGGAEAETEDTDYFAKARYERDCARSEAVEILKVSAESGGTEEIIDEISAEKIAMHAKNTEQETAIENMVKAKGYADCVAFVDDAGVRVVVKSDALEAEGVAIIKDIVVNQTGMRATDIRISGKE